MTTTRWTVSDRPVIEPRTTDASTTTERTAPTTVPRQRLDVPAPPMAPTAPVKVPRRTRRRITGLVGLGVLVAGAVGLGFLATRDDGTTTVSTPYGMSQQAWQAYRSGERATTGPLGPMDLRRDVWQEYRSGERASTVGVSQWQSYRSGERASVSDSTGWQAYRAGERAG